MVVVTVGTIVCVVTVVAVVVLTDVVAGGVVVKHSQSSGLRQGATQIHTIYGSDIELIK